MSNGNNGITPQGAVKAFVAQHADIKTAGVSEEARRLLPLAHEQGLQTTTLESLKSAIHRARQQGRRSRRRTHRPLTAQPKPGTMAEFVHLHVNTTASPTEEGKRLYDLYTSQGRQTTVGSMTQAVYAERWRRGIRPQANNQYTIHVRKPRRGRPPMITRDMVTHATQTPRPATEAVLGMIDDALKGLSTLRQAVRGIEADAKAYQRLKQQLKGLST